MKRNNMIVGLVVALPLLLQQSCSQFEEKPEKEHKRQDVPKPLNDTGISQTKYSSFQSDYFFKRENVKDFPGQDPQYGRDALASKGLLGDSESGFDFSSQGKCVYDNVTGLLWEVKTDASDSGLQSNKWTFTWDDVNPNQDIQLIYHDREAIVDTPEETTAIKEPELKHYEDFVINSGVLFDYDKYNLTAKAQQVLNETIAKFSDRLDLVRKISVIGHTDSHGSLPYNQKLSQNRSKTVTNYLKTIDNLPNKEIEAIGKGELEPIDTNLTDEGRARNRRVVIRLEFEVAAEEVPESDDNLDVFIDQGALIVKHKKIKTELVKHDTLSQIGIAQPESAVIPKCSDKANEYQCSATEYVAKMNEIELCGHSDWRLPNREELRSIVHYGESLPSIDRDYFPNTISSAYWTSTRYIQNRYNVWVVNFEHGGDNTQEKHRAIPIRVVRSEQKQNIN